MGNTVISEAEIWEVSVGDTANFANREVLISKEMLGRSDWYFKKWGHPIKDGRSCVIEAGFNDGDLFSFKRPIKYVDYLEDIYPKTKIIKRSKKQWNFSSGVKHRETHCRRRLPLYWLEMNSFLRMCV